MAENVYIPQSHSRQEIYEALVPQISALLASETDLVANLANISAVLKQAFGFFWIGFYLVKDNELVLGPFQGTLACTRIAFGKGVCGYCYAVGQTVIVSDVDAFAGHIACSSASKSEIVVPIFNKGGTIAAVLDVDSDKVNDFSDIDKQGLEAISQLISFE